MVNNHDRDGNRTAAVVVTYNRRELLKKCITCLLTQNGTACDVLVVDNASSDGTAEMVQAMAESRIFYRNTGANLGGAGGFNFGIRWAVEEKYDYVWVMDDDCLPNSDALSKLFEADNLLDGNYGFLSSVVLWTDGNECKMNRQKIYKAYNEHVELMKNGIIQVEQATFVSLLFPAEVIRKAGLPIKEFFIWGDDIEYTRRLAIRMNLPCYMVKQSRVIHAMFANNGSNISKDVPERLERYLYAFRNEAYLFRKEGLKGLCHYLAKCVMNFARIIGSHSKQKPLRLKILFAGILRGWRFNPVIEFLCSESEDSKL